MPAYNGQKGLMGKLMSTGRSFTKEKRRELSCQGRRVQGTRGRGEEPDLAAVLTYKNKRNEK